MDHERRIRLAEEITDIVNEKYGKEVLLGGVYGSAARGADTKFSDLEMLFIVEDDSNAKTVKFSYEHMPVEVNVIRRGEVENEIMEVSLDWPLRMGRLFNLKVMCGDPLLLDGFRGMLDEVPDREINEFIARQTPLCYEGLGRLKAVKLRGNTHEMPLFVMEVLMEFMLLVAAFNRRFINHDYLGGLPESFEFERLPPDYEENARRLMHDKTLSLDETISLAEGFVRNFVEYMAENGVRVREHTPLDEVQF